MRYGPIGTTLFTRKHQKAIDYGIKQAMLQPLAPVAAVFPSAFTAGRKRCFRSANRAWQRREIPTLRWEDIVLRGLHFVA